MLLDRDQRVDPTEQPAAHRQIPLIPVAPVRDNCTGGAKRDLDLGDPLLWRFPCFAPMRGHRRDIRNRSQPSTPWCKTVAETSDESRDRLHQMQDEGQRGSLDALQPRARGQREVRARRG